MKQVLLILSSIALLFSACDLENTSTGLSDEDIVEGLKTALEVGADSSTTILSSLNGYYMDEAVKILLPPEAEIVTTNLKKISSYIPGGESFMTNELEKLVLSLNRAAEDAADDALPILGNAIKGLSITDGLDILQGTVPSGTKSTGDFDSLAATHFMEQETKNELVSAFSTPINESLDKPLVGDVSTNYIWNNITSTYNQGVTVYNALPFVTDLEKVNGTLGEYATEKALSGLFLKVGEQEKKIRRNPWDWVTSTVGNILTKVFGSEQ
jgi:hypothetical protein